MCKPKYLNGNDTIRREIMQSQHPWNELMRPVTTKASSRFQNLQTKQCEPRCYTWDSDKKMSSIPSHTKILMGRFICFFFQPKYKTPNFFTSNFKHFPCFQRRRPEHVHEVHIKMKELDKICQYTEPLTVNTFVTKTNPSPETRNCKHSNQNPCLRQEIGSWRNNHQSEL